MKAKLVMKVVLTSGPAGRWEMSPVKPLVLKFDDFKDLSFRLFELCDGGSHFWPYDAIVDYADRLGDAVKKLAGVAVEPLSAAGATPLSPSVDRRLM